MISKKTRFTTLISLMIVTVISFTVPALARWGDGAGPAGLGPKTGLGVGYCAGYSVPGYQNTTVPRRGYYGYRRTGFQGGGRGFRNVYNATDLTRWQRVSTTPPVLTKEQQLEALKKQAEYLKNELEKITRLLDAAESEKE